jgi:hypothetical protein
LQKLVPVVKILGMINPYLGAIGDLLEHQEVSSHLWSLLPVKISVPIGYTYKLKAKFEDVVISPELVREESKMKIPW